MSIVPLPGGVMRLQRVLFTESDHVTLPAVPEYVMYLFLGEFAVLRRLDTDVGGLRTKSRY